MSDRGIGRSELAGNVDRRQMMAVGARDKTVETTNAVRH